MKTKWNGLWTAAVAVVLGGAGLAEAQVQEGITVVGTGTVQVKPNAIEIVGVVNGEAELAGDALVKYRDNKRRAIAAVEGLKIDGVKVEGTGFTINTSGGINPYQQVIFAGQQAQTPTPKIMVSEPLTITISSIQDLSEEDLVKRIIQVIDAGKDAGLTISGGARDRNSQMIRMQMGLPAEEGLVTFKLSEAEAERQKAYESAMKNARASAQRLAELAGVKLGGVVSVTEQNLANANRQVVYVYNYGNDESEDSSPTYRSSSFKTIPVSVTLSVRFQIQP